MTTRISDWIRVESFIKIRKLNQLWMNSNHKPNFPAQEMSFSHLKHDNRNFAWIWFGSFVKIRKSKQHWMNSIHKPNFPALEMNFSHLKHDNRNFASIWFGSFVKIRKSTQLWMKSYNTNHITNKIYLICCSLLGIFEAQRGTPILFWIWRGALISTLLYWNQFNFIFTRPKWNPSWTQYIYMCVLDKWRPNCSWDHGN